MEKEIIYIEDLIISKNKMFFNVKFENFNQFNIIAGMNNCGKSTLLNIIYNQSNGIKKLCNSKTFFADEIVVNTIDNDTIDFIKNINNDIKNVIIENNQYIFIDKRFNEKQTIDNYGSGFQKLIYYINCFEKAKNGIILFDDIEQHIDYETLMLLALLIIKFSNKYKAQVFLTTHSKEFIDNFFGYDCIDKITCYCLNDLRKFDGNDYDDLLDVMGIDLRIIGT